MTPTAPSRPDASAFKLRLLTPTDLEAYKRLRDESLRLHPEAFTSDHATEVLRPASVYASRLGPHALTLGAFDEVGQLLGAVTLERHTKIQQAHIGGLIGMMVTPPAMGRGVGRALIEALIAQGRATPGMEMLFLSVTASNARAVGLYEAAGFHAYGRLPRAIRVQGQFHDKLLMMMDLIP